LGAVERVLKTAPKGAVFCRYFTGTETYVYSPSSFIKQTTTTTLPDSPF
jgi:hypothetical protein